ncbi:aldo/keto reductase [Pedobacter sp.]|uniref:aldo/keto reductase n=1 Tax=Pedobacter sp. TaxID=1411316 RepID=UPI003D7F3800
MKNLPKIALGTWSWGKGAIGGDQIFGNSLTADDLKPVFHAAMEAGLNLWDTAAVYGMGASEEILGKFVRQSRREDIILSTKFTPNMAKATDFPVEDMFNESCERLGTDYIDIYWIHNPTDAPKWVPGLIPLLKSGKVKSVGVSNHNLDQIKEANQILEKDGFGISAVQNHFSLLYRASEDAGIIDYCQDNNITFFSYMVLEQGALSGKYNTQNPLPEGSGRAKSYNKTLPHLEKLISKMKDIGESKNASVAQVAVAWAIAKNTMPLIGVTKVSQVHDAANAARITLTNNEIEQIEVLAIETGINTRAAWEAPMT